MSIITQGYGPGSNIITQGYGFFRKIAEEIKKIVRTAIRYIPYRRKKFKVKIPVYGDLVAPYEEKIRVTGKKDFRKIIWTLLEDED